MVSEKDLKDFEKHTIAIVAGVLSTHAADVFSNFELKDDGDNSIYIPTDGGMIRIQVTATFIDGMTEPVPVITPPLNETEASLKRALDELARGEQKPIDELWNDAD